MINYICDYTRDYMYTFNFKYLWSIARSGEECIYQMLQVFK